MKSDLKEYDHRRDDRYQDSPARRRHRREEEEDAHDNNIRRRERSRSPPSKKNHHDEDRKARMARLRAENEQEEQQIAAAMEQDEGGAGGSKKGPQERIIEVNTEELEGLDEEEQMKALLGFGGGFGSTKGQKVDDNHKSSAKGAAAKNKARKYRQYMNRKNGFNRPLDKMD